MTAMFYFDDRGELVEPAERIKAQRLTIDAASSFQPQDCLSDSAASVTLQERSSQVEVRFDKEAVSPIALTGLMMWLNDRWQKPVVILGCEGTNRVDILRDRRQALAYLSDLIDQRQAKPHYVRRAAVLERTAFATVWRAAQELCQSSDVTEEAKVRVLEQLFAGVFCLNMFDPDSHQCRVSATGSAIKAVDPDFAARGVGPTYREMADRAYGNWIADTFDGYFNQDHTSAECVDATIAFPRRSGRLCYTRLVVPYVSRNKRHVLVATDAAQGVTQRT